jgi:hypothetical protein
MEMIVILVVVAGFAYVIYKAFTPKAVEVVLPEPTPEPVVEVVKPAAKKTVAKKTTTTTTRKPRTTTKK